MAFLQASAGPVELATGEAGILDARGKQGLKKLSVGISIGSSSHFCKATRVLSATATGHNEASTDMEALRVAGASSGDFGTADVDWPFYWVSMTSSGSSTGALAHVSLI